MDDFQVTQVDGPFGPTLVLEGELDMVGSARLRKELIRVEQTAEPRIALDLSRVLFVNSSGMSVIIGSYKRLKAASRALVISGTSPRVERMFRMLGLGNLFTPLTAES